jgi:glycosyltransferase involved in cell wall biosynthesis
VRILIVNTGIFPIPPQKGGGIETHVYYLVKNLAKLVDEIHCVTDITPKAELPSNVYIHKVHAPSFSFQISFLGWMLNHAIGQTMAFGSSFLESLRHSYDVIHAHGKLSAFLLLSSRKLAPKLVYTIHDPTPWMCTYETSYERLIRRAVYLTIEYNVWRKADHLIAVSKALRDELIGRWGIQKEKVTVIPNAVDTDFFKPVLGNKGIEKYAISNDYILFVGQLRSRKGVKYLLQAFAEAKVDMQLVIVGGGPELSALQRAARFLNIEQKVVFTGPVPSDDLPNLYANASFFVLPSVAEGLPLVVLEAMASGLPVVASEVSGIPDAVISGYNGLLVPPKDIRALANAIKILNTDHRLRKELASNAREFVERYFSWKIVAKKTLSVYQMLMKA